MKRFTSSALPFCMGAIFIAVAVWEPIRGMKSTAASALLIGQTHQVRKELEDVVEAEWSVLFQQRNYMLSADPIFLQRMNDSIARRKLELNEVRSVVGNSPDQHSRIDQLEVEINKLNQELAVEAVSLPGANLLSEEVRRIPRREAALARIEQITSEIDAVEDVLLQERTLGLQKRLVIESVLSNALGLVAAGILIYLFLRAKRDLAQKAVLEKELRQAHAAAESASKAKSYFLANMSHEIRTPLGAILGFTELLSTSGLSEEKRTAFLETVNRNGRDLCAIIDDILDLSKVEAGQLVIEILALDPRILAEGVVQLFSQKAASKGLHLNLEISRSVPEAVLGDGSRMRQILLNVVGNALKFTERGNIKIQMDWVSSSGDELKEDAKGLLQVKVIDTGKGITESQRKNLFKPFSQADESTSRQYGGTGLGLVLSRNLARALGGDLTLLSSGEGKGSVFLFTLPCQVVTKTDRVIKRLEGATILPHAKEKSGGRLAGRRILLADDSSDNQMLMSILLRSEGAIVEIVGDGVQALLKAKADFFDVILMDIQMPNLDGYDAARELRRLGHMQPIVALTAHAMKEERDRSFAAGCNDHITKPVSRESLVTAVERLCRS